MKITIDKWSALAFTRFVLAFIVAVGHMGEYVPLGWLAWVPQLGSFEAVLGFLLISGYSIGSSYAKEPAGFLIRRAWRIYPVYLGAIALTCLAIPPSHDATFSVTFFFRTRCSRIRSRPTRHSLARRGHSRWRSGSIA